MVAMCIHRKSRPCINWVGRVGGMIASWSGLGWVIDDSDAGKMPKIKEQEKILIDGQ